MKLWRLLGTPWLLEQWGRWANLPEDVRIGYPSKTNFATFQGKSIALPQIDDETAVIVDLGVKRLGELHCEYERAIVSTYLHRDSVQAMASRLKTNWHDGKSKLECGHAWMDCWLHQKLDKSKMKAPS